MGCVYVITNTVNGKQYIGCTMLHLGLRKRKHGSACKIEGREKYYELHKAMNEFGFDNFLFESVFEAEYVEDLEEKEKELIQSMETLYPDGYNMQKGGLGGFVTKSQQRPVRDEDTGIVYSGVLEACRVLHAGNNTINHSCETGLRIGGRLFSWYSKEELNGK